MPATLKVSFEQLPVQDFEFQFFALEGLEDKEFESMPEDELSARLVNHEVMSVERASAGPHGRYRVPLEVHPEYHVVARVQIERTGRTDLIRWGRGVPMNTHSLIVVVSKDGFDSEE